MSTDASPAEHSQPSGADPIGYVRPTHVIVRLDRGIEADSLDDLLAVATEFGLSDLFEQLIRHDVPARRVIREVPPEELRRIERENADDSQEWPSLTQYWRLDLRDGRFRPEEVASAFRALEVVERAYVEPPVVPAGGRAVRRARLAGQRAVPEGPSTALPTKASHLDAAPLGINARWVWETYGLYGEGVHLVDVEQGWLFDHEALRHLKVPPLLAGLNAHEAGGSGDHGAAVLGIVAGEYVPPNGVRGVCPRASVLAASHFQGFDDTIHVADTLASLGSLRPGDVVLLEVAAIEGSDDGYGDTVADQRPIERDECVQNAIGLLTRQGIVVIEAAGNGDQDLDRLGTDGDLAQLRVGAPGYLDSGAIMVGGAEVPSPSTVADCHPRWTDDYNPGIGSNYGSRVNSYAWARRVWSSGCEPYGSCDPRTSSYQIFTATSAASAIIAGAAVLLQAVHREYLGSSLEPEKLRELFADPDNGTDSLPDAQGGRLIGVMPDLRRVAAALGLA